MYTSYINIILGIPRRQQLDDLAAVLREQLDQDKGGANKEIRRNKKHTYTHDLQTRNHE